MKNLLSLLLICLLAATVSSSPYFLVEDFEDWGKLLGSTPPEPHIVPMQPLQWDDYMVQWNAFTEDGELYNFGQPTMFSPAELYVYEGLEGGGPEPPEEAGLIMTWGDDALPSGDYASAWIYDYGVDPDLTNCIITVTVIPPSASAINAISFGIQDVNGNIRSWWWSVPMMIPYDVPTTITIDTSVLGIGATNPPATGFMNNPMFDITKAQSFVADENSQWIGGPTPIPPIGQIGGRIWNYWQDVIVTRKTKANKGIWVKYSQPPEVVNPDQDRPLIYGWDVRSLLPFNFDNSVAISMAADDWICTDPRPITDIHWWGSFIGWDQPTLPPQVPDYFLMAIWKDIPQSADGSTPSQPAELLWSHKCYKWVWNFAGYDLDPRFEYGDQGYDMDLLGMAQENEACFQFNQLLSEDDWFYQEPMEDPTVGNVYWLSIAAVYENTPVEQIQYPWGWKTKPYDPAKAPDAAVVIQQLDPGTPPFDTALAPGTGGHVTKVTQFFPLLLPFPADYPNGRWYDLAFELTTNQKEPGTCYDLAGDINHDCIVDLADLAIVSADWLKTSIP